MIRDIGRSAGILLAIGMLASIGSAQGLGQFPDIDLPKLKEAARRRSSLPGTLVADKMDLWGEADDYASQPIVFLSNKNRQGYLPNCGGIVELKMDLTNIWLKFKEVDRCAYIDIRSATGVLIRSLEQRNNRWSGALVIATKQPQDRWDIHLKVVARSYNNKPYELIMVGFSWQQLYDQTGVYATVTPRTCWFRMIESDQCVYQCRDGSQYRQSVQEPDYWNRNSGSNITCPQLVFPF